MFGVSCRRVGQGGSLPSRGRADVVSERVCRMKIFVGTYLVHVGWSACIWSERGRTSGAPSGHGRRIGYTKDVLRIQIAFLVLAGLELCNIIGSLLIVAAVDDFNGEGVGSIDRIGSELLQEQLDIGAIVRVTEVVSHTNLVLARSLGRVVDGAVKSAEALRGDALSVADGIDVLGGLRWWRLTVSGPRNQLLVDKIAVVAVGRVGRVPVDDPEIATFGVRPHEGGGRLDYVDVVVKVPGY